VSTLPEQLTNLCTARQVFGMHRAGAFGEFVSVPERVLFQWPTTLTAGEATMAEPLANGVNVIQIDPSISKERVIVLGAGPIGLMCMVAARSIAKSSVIVSDLIVTACRSHENWAQWPRLIRS
jgi:threonine dehydrogenase-like Zn-dependent dehydrogenase